MSRAPFIRTLIVLASFAAGLALAELGAAAARGGAFPHLNCFEPDPQLGVRLQPGASTRLRTRTGRVSWVSVNAEGFRGPPFPAPVREGPVPGRILVVGDSQVFAYGVEWADGMVAQLARQLGRPGEVLGAAVPSWGPHEYARAGEALGARFRPEWVLLVANVANDWVEASVENSRRTTAQDGWAVRYSPELRPPTSFPGRGFLMRRSHLVYALRRIGARTMGARAPPAVDAERLRRDLSILAAPAGAMRSRLSPFLARLSTACAALGCRVGVVALPLDVQVHPGEWAKYRSAPVELAATGRLLDDLLADARERGWLAVDPRPALRAASPGAFLSDEFHLSPAGHQAVAQAIAREVRG